MKKIVTLALLLSSISFGAYAQQTSKKDSKADRKRTELVDKTAEEIAKKRTDHIDKEVNLTEKQRKDIYNLYLNEAKAKIEAEEKASQADTSAPKSNKKDSNDEVHKLLTPEQHKVLTDNKSKKESQKKGKNKNKTKNTNSTSK